MDPITIGAIGSMVAGAGNTASQIWLNKQQIKYAREAMQTQRNWALEDWDKVNQYNSPQQQMQRFKEAGLNPHLIYGNANNTPAGMVRTTNIQTPNIGNAGFIAASNNMAAGASAMVNNYFAAKSLENDTQLKQAQVLNLKSQSDRTRLQNEITQKAFDDLVQRQYVDNELKKSNISYNWAKEAETVKRTDNMPTKEMTFEKYLAEIAKTDAEAKHALEKFKLAKQQGELKQWDLDMMERLALAPNGVRLILEFLRSIPR